MRAVATLAVLLLVPAAAGSPVRRSVGTAAAWAFGVIGLSLTFAALHLAGAPRTTTIAVVVAMALVSALAGVRTWRDAPPRWTLWSAGMAILAVLVALNTVWLPVEEWDAVVIWYAKARHLLEWRPLAALADPTYPDLGPSAWSMLLLVSGLDNEPVARLVFPMLTIAWLSMLPRLAWRPARVRPLTTAMLLAVAVGAIDIRTVTDGYQDAPLCALAGISAVLLGRALIDGERASRGAIAVALAVAGSMALLKREGALLAALLTIAWFGTFAWTHGVATLRARVPSWSVAALVMLAASWAIVEKTMIHLPAFGVRSFEFEPVALGILWDRAGRIPAVLSAATTFYPTYRLTVMAAAAASAAAWTVRWTRPILVWLWAVAAAQFASLVPIFMLTNADLQWHLQTALLRLVSQQAFVWIIALALAVIALLEPERVAELP
jgi:hypothetical protein